ncbi:hypothetical protein BDW22DRAFT_1439518 [Trametopsis cervina]|nr:hypothetical protein BDW22DRAFT_1439518 [Trametopsis cervina]
MQAVLMSHKKKKTFALCKVVRAQKCVEPPKNSEDADGWEKNTREKRRSSGVQCGGRQEQWCISTGSLPFRSVEGRSRFQEADLITLAQHAWLRCWQGAQYKGRAVLVAEQCAKACEQSARDNPTPEIAWRCCSVTVPHLALKSSSIRDPRTFCFATPRRAARTIRPSTDGVREAVLLRAAGCPRPECAVGTSITTGTQDYFERTAARVLCSRRDDNENKLSRGRAHCRSRSRQGADEARRRVASLFSASVVEARRGVDREPPWCISSSPKLSPLSLQVPASGETAPVYPQLAGAALIHRAGSNLVTARANMLEGHRKPTPGSLSCLQ